MAAQAAEARLRGAQSVLLACLFASLTAAALFWSVGDVNLNLADEGYLWYGVLGVLEGEVPFRDFQAYDPGRYRWCAIGSWFFGSGILGVRASLAVFQALGLAAGLLVARRFLKHDLWMLPLAIILGLWMFPRHKLFEPALAMLVLWSCVRLLEQPSLMRHLAAGVCVGLVAWFGRNHGLYSGVGMGLAFGYLGWKRGWAGSLRRAAALAGGVLLGYVPMLANFVLVPGFGAAYWRELTELASKGANLPKAYPWPWSVAWGVEAGGWELAGVWATNLAFLLPLVIVPLGLWRLLRIARGQGAANTPEPAVEQGAEPASDLNRSASGARQPGFDPAQAALIGSTIIGTIYLHHVAIRSDVQHLGQCLQPLLLAGLALGTKRWTQIISVSLLSILTLCFSLQNHSTLRWFAPWRPEYNLVEQNVAGETLRLNPAQARYIQTLQDVLSPRLKPEDKIFIAPTRATFYPLLGKRAPVREIYLLWPASDAEQQAMISSLEDQKIRWALVLSTTVDKRADLRFDKTHPLVVQYLLANYREVPSALDQSHRLMRRKR